MLEKLGKTISYRVEREALANYFVVSLTDSDDMINYQAEMLEHNEALGLIKFDRRRRNEEIELWYDTSLFEELERHVDRNKLEGKQFIIFFESLVHILLNSNKLFLEENRYVLDKDKIFVDKDMKPALLYLPIKTAEYPLKEKFKELFEYLSNHVQISAGVGDAIQILLKEMNSVHFNFKGFAEKINQVKEQYMGIHQDVPLRIKPVPLEPVNFSKEVSSVAEVESPIELKQEYVKQDSGLSSGTKDMLIKKSIGDKTERQKAKKGQRDKSKPQAESNMILRIVLIQILVMLGVAAPIQWGVLKAFDGAQIAGFGLIILVIDFLIVRKILSLEGEKPAPKKEKQEKKKPKRMRQEQKLEDVKIENTPIQKQQKWKSSQPINDESVHNTSEQTMINVENDCTIIMDQEQSYAYLIHAEGGMDTRVSISSNPFIMGKSHQGVDLICTSKHISRMHAQIIQENGQYYVIDLSSTNGTWLNETKLDPNMKYPLCSTDTITLAKDKYTFLLPGIGA